MDLSNLHPPTGAKRPKKRVGRGEGSGQGCQSGRGHKGAKSRSGFRRKRGFEGGQMPLVRRIPKRGFSNYPFRKAWAELNLSQLERFAAGSTVDPEVLAGCGLVKGRFDGIVILGGGELEVALTVKAHRFSKSAVAKIEAAGGKAEVIQRAAGKAEVSEPRASKVEAVEATADEVEAALVAIIQHEIERVDEEDTASCQLPPTVGYRGGDGPTEVCAGHGRQESANGEHHRVPTLRDLASLGPEAVQKVVSGPRDTYGGADDQSAETLGQTHLSAR